MEVNINGSRMAAKYKGGDGIGEGLKSKEPDNTRAPTIPRDVKHLGFGTMLLEKFSALKQAISKGDLSQYSSIKEERKAEIRQQRFERLEEANAGKVTYGGFAEAPGHAAKLLCEANNPAAVCVQLTKLINESKGDGVFDPAKFRSELKDLMRHLNYEAYKSFSPDSLLRALGEMEKNKHLDANFESKKQALGSLINLLDGLKNPSTARDIFLADAKVAVRDGQVNNYLRLNQHSAPLLFINRAVGGLNIQQDCEVISRKFLGASKSLTTEMTTRREEINKEIKTENDLTTEQNKNLPKEEQKGTKNYVSLQINKTNPDISREEGIKLLDLSKAMLEDIKKLKPSDEFKSFLREMVAEIRNAHPNNPDLVSAKISKLYNDQVYLRNVSPIISITQQKEKSPAGLVAADILQAYLNGGNFDKIKSVELKTLLEENMGTIMKQINDVLVEAFGMPVDGHPDFKPGNMPGVVGLQQMPNENQIDDGKQDVSEEVEPKDMDESEEIYLTDDAIDSIYEKPSKDGVGNGERKTDKNEKFDPLSKINPDIFDPNSNVTLTDEELKFLITEYSKNDVVNKEPKIDEGKKSDPSSMTNPKVIVQPEDYLTDEEIDMMFEKASNNDVGKGESTIDEGKKVESNKIEIKEIEIKESDVKKDKIKESDVKASNIKNEEIKESDVKASNIKKDEIKESDVKASNIKNDDNKETVGKSTNEDDDGVVTDDDGDLSETDVDGDESDDDLSDWEEKNRKFWKPL